MLVSLAYLLRCRPWVGNRNSMRPSVWLATCALAVTAMACAGNAVGGADGGAAASVKGVIIQVDASSLIDLKSMDLKDENGDSWHFVASEEYEGFPPSHLREHMVQGLPIMVTYHEEGGSLVVDDVKD